MPIALTVSSVMDKNMIFMDSAAPVSEVIKKMVGQNVWSALITRDGLPVGVVTERDILRRCLVKGKNPDRTKAEEIMSSPLLTIEPKASLGEAMSRMISNDVRRLYVVEGGKAIGRVTQTSLFQSMFDTMESLLSSAY